ncbi:SDR family oxidoreductase [Methylobacterium brachythecii]|uniref:NAD(P)-dependent dehydrogenase (Short-subunit alcohol dehydrogenase family) n=1 Tax=Methylobacterium brachythecii TaxID=1176177 RepID=A0A7W6AKJ6_9HYPH|nr:SDR family oxidoreductase [Methylobacterium brachythecii]MBB3902940.1 NAD(P)-dependent dehydrogenase (short-subunit alcohol dehydrogenase family) [Methylobacterium brachythecii]GLS43866.1 short-chain dehydrogenase [Methylobacterium brachythecii]
MRSKSCLVTGASSGIGFETALGLSRAGARVGIVGRSRERTEAAAARIRAAAGGPVDTFVADLSSQAETRRLADEVLALYPRLDLLVNNAGAIFDRRMVTVDGLERTWALDHLAYLQLTLALLDRLKASAPARIVNLSSAAHTRGRIALDDLNGERTFGGMKAYSQAKLGNLLFTYALGRRLEGSGVTVNAVHPGVVASGFAKNLNGPLGVAWGLMRPFLISTADGARTTLHVATAPELERISGRYFAKSRETTSSARSLDEAMQEQVWSVSLKQLSLTDAAAGGITPSLPPS